MRKAKLANFKQRENVNNKINVREKKKIFKRYYNFLNTPIITKLILDIN